LLLILLFLLNILIYFVSRFFVLDQKVAKIYTAAWLSRYILPGLLLPFLLELSYRDVGSAFSNLSAYFAPLVSFAVLLFR
jgi:hypothetical protein